MKKSIKFLMLAFMTMLACVSLSSCSGDDEAEKKVEKDYYRLRLENLDTNCTDGDKYTINIAVPQGMEKIQDVDFVQASSDKEAISLFNQLMDSFKTNCVDFYKQAGSLKEGDYVTYKFILYNSSRHQMDDLAVCTFTVTKDGIK